MSGFKWDIGRAVAITAIVVLTAMLINAPSINACFNPSDVYSVEVLLNKPGVFLNSTLLEGVPGVFKVNEYYVYRSVDNIAVIVYLEEVFNGAPLVPGINEGEPIELYPGIRLELMDVGFEGSWAQLNESMVKYYSDLLKSTLLIELDRLTNTGILMGLSSSDLEEVVKSACIGCAGWNERLVYYVNDGTWRRYSELIAGGAIRGALIRSLGCRFEIPDELMKALAVQQPPWLCTLAPPASTPSHGLNGVAVALSIVVGVAVAAAFYMLYARMK